MFLLCKVLSAKINTLKVTKTLFRKNISRLRCIILCWIATGCGHGYETVEKIAYAYARINKNSDVPLNERIKEYKVLINECKKHLSLKEEVEKLSYADIRDAHRAFARKFHPDSGSGGDKEKFQEEGEAWNALNDALDKDDKEGKNKLGEQNLKEIKEPLLTYLERYLKKRIEKNIEHSVTKTQQPLLNSQTICL